MGQSAESGIEPTEWGNWSEDEYKALRVAACRIMATSRANHTLSPENLISEAWLRVECHSQKRGGPTDRGHLIALMTQAMRHSMIDYERGRFCRKRLGHHVQLKNQATSPARYTVSHSVIAALEKLKAMDPRLGRLVELRFYFGYSVSETARILARSERTVARDWNIAKAFLASELKSA